MFIPKAAPKPKQKKVHKMVLTVLSHGWNWQNVTTEQMKFSSTEAHKSTSFLDIHHIDHYGTNDSHLFNFIPQKHGTNFNATKEAKDMGHDRHTWIIKMIVVAMMMLILMITMIIMMVVVMLRIANVMIKQKQFVNTSILIVVSAIGCWTKFQSFKALLFLHLANKKYLFCKNFYLPAITSIVVKRMIWSIRPQKARGDLWKYWICFSQEKTYIDYRGYHMGDNTTHRARQYLKRTTRSSCQFIRQWERLAPLKYKMVS